MYVGRHLRVVVNPRDVGIAWRIDAFVANHGNLQRLSHLGNRLMKLCGKRVSGIDEEPDGVLEAERFNGHSIHSPADDGAVAKR